MSYQGYPPSDSYGPAQPQYFGPPSDDPPRRQKRRGVPTWLAFLFAFVAGIAGFVAGVAASGSTSTATAQQPSAKPVASKAAAAAPAAKPRAATIPDDGTYLVPGEVKAGTYKAPGSERCYWARLKNTDGGVDSIIANSIQPGPQVVTIKATDKAFQTTGCGTWTKVA